MVEYLDVYDPIYHIKRGDVREKLEKLLESAINREIFGHKVTVKINLT